ncbi:hypothetical protein AHAS_Ahas13G0132200 [Arachis hypogaea]
MLTTNPILHDKIKYFQLDIQFIRDKVKTNTLYIIHISEIEQIADILVKLPSTPTFKKFQHKARVIQKSVLSLRGL